jgi:hypothetical protein
LSSVAVLVHAVPHTIWLVGQEQVPPEHVAPVAHTVPQPPQLLVSVLVLVQDPLQFV